MVGAPGRFRCALAYIVAQNKNIGDPVRLIIFPIISADHSVFA